MIDDIFEVLRRGLSFSELDLVYECMQISVTDESRNLVKLTEATACTPVEYQQIINE